jgi:hypothetical protein
MQRWYGAGGEGVALSALSKIRWRADFAQGRRKDRRATAEGTLLPENSREELRRDMARLRVVREQLREIVQQRLRKLEAAAPTERGPHEMIRLIARVTSETADMLVGEILTRHLRDSNAIARKAGLTDSPNFYASQRRSVKDAGRRTKSSSASGPICHPSACGTLTPSAPRHIPQKLRCIKL